MGNDIKDFSVMETIEFKKLKRKTIEKVITMENGESIIIYYPDDKAIQKIVELQLEDTIMIKDGKMAVNSMDIIDKVFPVLTNIDFSDLSIGEKEDIIDNPSLELLETTEVIKRLIYMINRYYYEKMQTKIELEMSKDKLVELMNTIPRVLVQNNKLEDMQEYFDNIEEFNTLAEQDSVTKENEEDLQTADKNEDEEIEG